MTRQTTWLWIFALALLPRLGWVLLNWARTGTAFSYPDEQLHWDLAVNLVEQGSLVSADGRHVARMPGYPVYLALFAWLGESAILLARIGQALLGAWTAVIAARLATRCCGFWSGILAGVLVALDPFNIFFGNLLLTEVLFTLLALLLCERWLIHWNTGAECPPPLEGTGHLCEAGAESPSPLEGAEPPDAQRGQAGRTDVSRCPIPSKGGGPSAPQAGCPIPSRGGGLPAPLANSNRTWLLTGLLAAATLFVRPAGAPWLGLGMVLVALGAAGWRNIPRAAGAFGLQVLPIILLLLPWGLRNRAIVGDFAWLSGNGGVTLYDAQGPQADGSSDQTFLRDPQWQGMRELERDRALYAAAVEQMKSDPARVLELAWIKIRRTWSLFPNVAEHRAGATAYASAAYTGLTGLLALLGIARLVRNQRRALLLWLLPIVTFTLLHAVFIGSVRYRIPLMPFVVLIGAAAVMRRKEDPRLEA